jgi:hypothetical protein
MLLGASLLSLPLSCSRNILMWGGGRSKTAFWEQVPGQVAFMR